MKRQIAIICAWSVLVLVTGCNPATTSPAQKGPADDGLVGAWRAKVQFRSGALADFKDLEFMYVFNTGGTMTESSNYDAAPPVPPAYGVWRKTGPRQFEASYQFFATKAANPLEEIARGGGWLPDGHGVLSEKIALAEDGKSYQSVVRYDAFDQAGKPSETGIEGTSQGSRIGF
jgi:hypothetical protein